MTNQCKNNARKSCAKNMRKHHKWSQTVSRNPRQFKKKRRPKIDAKKEAHARIRPEGRRLVRAPLLRLNHLFSTRFRLRLVISSRLVFVFVSSSSSRRLLSSFDIPYRLLFVPSLSYQTSKTSLCQIANRSVAKANDATHIVRRVLRM